MAAELLAFINYCWKKHNLNKHRFNVSYLLVCLKISVIKVRIKKENGVPYFCMP